VSPDLERRDDVGGGGWVGGWVVGWAGMGGMSAQRNVFLHTAQERGSGKGCQTLLMCC
jgi:hypothetical protein